MATAIVGSARVAETEYAAGLNPAVPRGTCGFESHPGHTVAGPSPQVEDLLLPAKSVQGLDPIHFPSKRSKGYASSP
jgi:hypothetical protein